MKIVVTLSMFLFLVGTLSACSPLSGEATGNEDNGDQTTLSEAAPRGTDSDGTNDKPGSDCLVIQGIFDPTGEKLLELSPIRRFSWDCGESPFTPRGIFLVEVIWEDGDSTIVKFDALVAEDTEEEVMEHGFFEVFIPVMDKIASIRITDASGEKTFARIDGSEIPP